MKKLLVLLLAIMMMVGITGCGNKDTSEDMYQDDVAAEVEVTEEKVEEAEVAEPAEEVQEEVEEVQEEVSIYPLTLTDKFGQEVVIESEPMTVISMSPEITEIIFAIGGGDRLIGRSSYCDYPEQAASVADFGTLLDVNVESVVAAQPDVIFLSSMASEEATMNLKNQGLSVVVLDKDGTLDGTYDYFKSVGQVLNLEEASNTLAMDIESHITEISTKVAEYEAPSVYYVVYAGDGYDSTATGDTFIHHMITKANGQNVAEKGEFWSYSVEQLVEDDPYLMVCSMRWETKAKIQGLEGYKDLTAVLEDRLYEVDENIFSRQGPRIGEAVEVLARIFHPVAFE